MRTLLHILSRSAAFLLEAMVRLYQVSLSPLLVGSCKFHPSCSEYLAQAVREWGVIRGGWLGLKRLLRCRPGTLGGLDPVPKKETPVQPDGTVDRTRAATACGKPAKSGRSR